MQRTIVVTIATTIAFSFASPGFGQEESKQRDANPHVIKPQDRQVKFKRLDDLVVRTQKLTTRTRERVSVVRRVAATSLLRGEQPVSLEQLQALSSSIDEIEQTLSLLRTSLVRARQVEAARTLSDADRRLPAARRAISELGDVETVEELQQNLQTIEGAMNGVDQVMQRVNVTIPGSE